ncbi:MAG TPA: DUF4097 family beta strand repeat-containing protein [Terriglobales bacterium]|jgi:DUF4097 and DUF4098 domain-containing protein YvlB|nr:DUF4097 family beta strand repeat-containing protein [Terriglobales bacterium]
MRHTKTLVAVLIGFALTAGAVRARAAVEGSFERSLKVTGATDIDVKTGSGDISVRQGEPGTVRIAGRIKARSGWLADTGMSPEERVRNLEQNPPISQTGNSIRIGHIDDPELKRNVSISYEITVPAETRLRSESGSGNQSIDGVKGPVRAGTGSGNVTISSVSDEVRAETGSGDLSLRALGSGVYANTGSGNIRATSVSGRFVGQTGSGDVRIEQSRLRHVDIQTGSGNIFAEGVGGTLIVSTGSGDITVEGKQAGEWKLEAGSGTIHVRLPSDAAFDLRAHTGSGRINTAHPLTVVGAMSRHDMRGKVRGGGALIDVSTGSGDIELQ